MLSWQYMEYCSALKREEALTHASSKEGGTIRMKPVDVMLSKITQSQKENTIWFCLTYEVFKIVKFVEPKSEMVVVRDLGEEEMGSY